jgi:hypothetical protein
MYQITEHCQKCDATVVITVDDEVYKGGVDADWHCGEPMIWSDETDIEYGEIIS